MSAILRIDNLDPRVTKDTLQSIIDVLSASHSVYIRQHNNTSFSIVKFSDTQIAEQVKHALDDRNLCGQKISVKWNEPVNIYVSNLSTNITTDVLLNAFQEFHVCHIELLSHGKALLTFLCQEDAEEAVQLMNGKNILSSPIYCHWPTESQTTSSTHSRRPSSNSDISISNMSYEELFAQTPLHNTYICITNLSKKCVSQDIVPHLQQYGSVSDIYMVPDKRRAVVKLDTHANATSAIFALDGTTLAGRRVRLNWAKEKYIEQAENHHRLTHSIGLFPSILLPPKQTMDQLLNIEHCHITARPPAPAFSSNVTGDFHGWNQFDQTYYSQTY
ncbi:hypothetical protein EDC96DRAFT_497428 [Choanephora cucurbitarum]|nr:hypothetical protein EDC96DRAFT_497428 [Choanephora cucurbitarum]